jgi:hypothetical protein
MLRCVRTDEDEAEQRIEEEEEEEQCGEEEEEAELEHVSRQTRRSHVVAPPPVPAREDDRVLIRPVGGQ